MRNTDYNPQISAYSGNTARRKKRKLIRFLRLFIFVMVVLIISVSCVLFWHLIGKQADKTNPATITSGKTTTTLTSGGETSTTPSESTLSTTPVPEMTELIVSTDMVETFFGPLAQPEKITELNRKSVKGIYTGAAGNLEQNIELAANSEINAFVIDLKESYGVAFNSSNALATEIGDVKSLYNLTTVVEQCHANDIWVIGRIVCFKDPGLAAAHPELSIQDANGVSLKFKNEGSLAFVSPYNKDAWDYYIDLAIEAVEAGVDEIQFDYVRFPIGKTTSGESPYYGPEGQTPSKSEAINRFLQTARRRIQDTYGVPVSADVFGIILTSTTDGKNLGQDWGSIGLTGVDSLCPMIYPSHYALGTMMNGHTFEKPDLEPYDVLYSALKLGSEKASAEGFATVRPYLQAFTASYIGSGNYMTYSYTEINEEIKGAKAAGYDEWILWNANAKYPQGAYDGK
jgi:hypothetical protein